jgi:hypothetical protein
MAIRVDDGDGSWTLATPSIFFGAMAVDCNQISRAGELTR